MDPLDDVRLDHVPTPPAERRENRATLTIVTVVLVLFASILGFLVWRKPASVAQTTAPRAEAPAETGRGALGPNVAPIDLPPIDLSDPLVRSLLGELSTRPELAAWLATDGLIRGFAASVDNVATGASPARRLRVLTPTARFRAESRGGRVVISEGSYERYSGIADTVASLDPPGLAKAYSTLKPRLDEAYRELGHPDGHIDAAVEQAIVHLLQTPVPSGDVVVKENVKSYRFASPELEELTAAQKQLIRMGPRNMRIIQRQLWAIARELGIPSERLPPPITS